MCLFTEFFSFIIYILQQQPSCHLKSVEVQCQLEEGIYLEKEGFMDLSIRNELFLNYFVALRRA